MTRRLLTPALALFALFLAVEVSSQTRSTAKPLKLTKRFTRVDANTIKYQVTIDDPKTYTAPWTVSFPITQEPGYQLFEYACHEGNCAMFNSLSGSRAEEEAK